MSPARLVPPLAPRTATPPPLPSPSDVVALQSVRSYPAVSVLCTTTPAPRMTAADAARLAALVAEAETRLVGEFGDGPSAALRGRLRELAGAAAGGPVRAGVALFACAHSSSAWSLPVPVLDRAVVDPTFATRDLVRSLHRTPRHVVLVLTEHEARLFDGAGEALRPALGSAFPLHRPGSRGGGPRSGAGTAARVALAQRESFYRSVDRALGSYLRLHPAPLVLVGARRAVTAFVQQSRNTGRLAGTVSGSHARTPLPELARLVCPVLEEYLHSRQAEALAILDRRAGAGRVVTGMPAVWLAARADRPELLAVEEGMFYPARLSADGDLVLPAGDVEHPEVIDDAVDEVIEIVLQRGGWVALVDDGALVSAERIALAVRA